MRVGYGYTLRVFRTASVRTIYELGRIAKLPGIQLIVVLCLALITGLRFRGPYYPPPASPAEACVALAADHLAFAALALLGGPHWQHGAKQQANPTRCRSKHELRNLRKAKASMQRKKKCAARVRIICCRVVSVFTRSELCNRSGLPLAQELVAEGGAFAAGTTGGARHETDH